jgi:hypothetical protein
VALDPGLFYSAFRFCKCSKHMVPVSGSILCEIPMQPDRGYGVAF